MSGFGVLFILLFISSIPAIAVFTWFRLARYPFSLPRFSFSLLAGAVAVFPALLLQSIFTARSEILYAAGKWGITADIFVRIAFTEEFSRLIMLIILFSAIRWFNATRQRDSDLSVTISADTMASASGLIAGLGFAILESAAYGASNPDNTLLRTFTAALLHGACGFRAGSAVALFPERPIQAIFRFLSAVVIHGIYNFMLIIGGFLPPIAAILIAISALATSVLAIHTGMKGEETYNEPRA